MKLHLLTGFTALGCVLLASCYPYNENQNRKKPVEKSEQKELTSAEQKKIQEDRDKMKEKAKKKAGSTSDGESGTSTSSNSSFGSTPSNDLPKPTQPASVKPEYKFASKVPGKDGFVLSPYNGKVVDVRDIPSGTLVQDPTYTGDGKGYFRVP